MAEKFELLLSGSEGASGRAILRRMNEAACVLGIPARFTSAYSGRCEWLMIYGAGDPVRASYRQRHLESGGHVICWDMGYFGRKNPERDQTGLRLSIDHLHPQAWLDRTPSDPARWQQHGSGLRNDGNPEGHIVLVGMGPKSHRFLGTYGWEARTLDELRERFPGRRIVYRPKPGREYVALNCETDDKSPIDRVLEGAALVVCRHSNVAVDAVIAGVPSECQDGAAKWLEGRPFTESVRLDFLRRLSWWQWKPAEAQQAWGFIQRMIACA